MVKTVLLPSRQAAEAVAKALDEQLVDHPLRLLLYQRVRKLVLGPPLAGRWGADPVADHLRLRQERWHDACHTTSPSDHSVWDGVLVWLGGELERIDLVDMPAEAAAAYAAAMTARHESRAVLERLARRFQPHQRSCDPARKTMARLALMEALGERFSVAAVAWLCPPPEVFDGKHPVGVAAAAPALLALLAYREAGNTVGEAHLLAALTVTAYRTGLRHAARMAEPVPRWGASRDAAFISVARRALAQLNMAGHSSWDGCAPTVYPAGWGAPLPREVEEAFAAWLHCDRWRVRQLLLDDALTLAAFYGLLGLAPSAHACLMSIMAEAATAEMRALIEAALRRHAAPRSVPCDETTRPVKNLATKLREYRDPGLEIGTPYWALPKSEIYQRLAKRKQGELATVVRIALSDDNCRQLEPFWLLGRDDELSLRVLIDWLQPRRRGPSRYEAVLFLERIWRQMRS